MSWYPLAIQYINKGQMCSHSSQTAGGKASPYQWKNLGTSEKEMSLQLRLHLKAKCYSVARAEYTGKISHFCFLT